MRRKVYESKGGDYLFAIVYDGVIISGFSWMEKARKKSKLLASLLRLRNIKKLAFPWR